MPVALNKHKKIRLPQRASKEAYFSSINNVKQDFKELLVTLKRSLLYTFLLLVYKVLYTISHIATVPIVSLYVLIKKLQKIEFKFRLFSITSFVLLLVVLALSFIGFISIFVVTEVPSSEMLYYADPKLTSRIYDRKGNLLYRVYSEEDRTLIKLSDVPENVINATLAIEDESFYKHKGLSIKGITRAAKRTFLEQDLEGGSTITQQLVKNTLLTPERTFERKFKEAILSLEVERRFKKDQILEMYLNKISYGGTAHGIVSAASKYFGKNLEDLSLAEAAFLAGLPASPSNYSPFGPNPEIYKARVNLVLNRMVEVGFVTKKEADKAKKEQLVFKKQSEFLNAPHFVNYTIAQLEKTYGSALVSQGGLDIYTSLDPEMQRSLEGIVQRNVEELRKYNKVNNGAVLVINPKTGEIYAMVGSVNFWDINNDGNVNITTSPRQPGSSIKPITYALAFESGYNLNSRVYDREVVYPLVNQKAYRPVNYDGKYHGVVTLKRALSNSYNIPAVKVLNKLGVDNLIDFASTLGITTWKSQRNRFGLSLTLGAGEVKMVDLASAYAVFANGGYRVDLNPVLKIYSSTSEPIDENNCVKLENTTPTILTRKETLEKKVMNLVSNDVLGAVTTKSCSQERVVKASTATMITDILADNNARMPAFGPASKLNITTKEIAVKTGTTQDLRDNWAIGYTNDYVVAAWVGNNDNTPMRNVVSGYRGASVIWRETIDYLIENYDIKNKINRPVKISNIPKIDIENIDSTVVNEKAEENKDD